MGMMFLSGFGLPSEAIEIANSNVDENNQSNYMAELALTIIDYDHYTHIATNLDLGLLNFSSEERKRLALDLNPSEGSSQSIAKTPIPSVEGINILLSDINQNNQSNTLYSSYMASNLEVIASAIEQKKNLIAVLPKTDVNNIYDSVYEFDIAMEKKVNTLSSSLGEMLSNDNNPDKSAQETQMKYNGLQTEMVSYLNDYAKTERAKMINQASNGATLAQVAGGYSAPRPSGGTRSNWFVFFAIGQQMANSSDLIGTEMVDPVQQQLALQQATRARIEQKTHSFYRPPITNNFRY